MQTSPDRVDELFTCQVERALKAASEQWAHVAYDNYTPFHLLVDLLPHSVHRQADTLLQRMPQKRLLIGEDYAQAAWQFVCEGIEALRPECERNDPLLKALGQAGSRRAWPAGLSIPRLWARYSILYLKYVTKSHTNKDLARLCELSIRQVITIRNHGLRDVACRLVAWERQLMDQAAPRTHLDADRRQFSGAVLQQRDSITAAQRI